MQQAVRLVVLVAFLFGVVYSQSVEPPYQVGIWRGFRTVAVSFTFDDNTPNQLAKAVPMFNEYGFKLTLFTVTDKNWGWPADRQALRQAALQGHEVASHTVTHTNFGGMSDEQQIFELQESQKTIEAWIPEAKCVTIAYPFCVAAKKALCEKYYLAARICSGSIVSNNTSDFMNISSIICGDQGSVRTGKDFFSRAKSALKSKGWCVFLLHGVDNDGGWSPVDSRELRAALDSLKAAPNEYWVESFGAVARYILARKAAVVKQTAASDNAITLQITDSLPDSIFNVPLSLRRPLPQGWADAEVTQNAEPIPSQIVEIDGIRMLQFDAIPDAGEIVLTRKDAAKVDRNNVRPHVPSLPQNFPNPFNPATVLHFELPSEAYVTLTVCDLHGRTVRTLLSGRLPGGEHSLSWNGEDDAGRAAAAGIYLSRLQIDTQKGNKQVLTGKMSLVR